MDVQALIESLQGTLGASLPAIGGALLLLVGGWLVALIARAIVRRGLSAIGVNERLEASTESQIDVESGAAKLVYYTILVIALVGFFNALNLQAVSGSLQTLVDQILAFVPKLIGAGVLTIVAWVIGTLLRSLATRGLAATGLDERLASEAGVRPPSESLGNVLFWLVFLLFLPGILGALEMQGLLAPVQSMVDDLLAMLPNVFGAGVIGAVGWFVARILRDLVSNLLAAAGADSLGDRAGLQGNMRPSALAGLVVYVFTFVPALIAALQALHIDAISVPATEMLAAFLTAIPNLFAAGVILAVAWVASSFVAELATSLLGGAGFDRLPERAGLAGLVPEQTTASQLVGRLVVFFVMLFAVSEAANRMGFGQVEGVVATLIAFGGDVLLGLVIIGVGFWISDVARDTVLRVGGDGANAMAGIARFGILGVVIAMGLRAMGLADDIVNLAFGLTLGSVAVAVALSFGLGGREAAGRQMEHWFTQLRGD